MSLPTEFTLANGQRLPAIGYGTAESKDGGETIDKVQRALQCGYRLIDTASIYGNEVSIGKAIAHSKIARADLFVTSKLWNPDQGYQKALDAFEKTLDNLQLDYLDLYLIHWPVPMGHEKDYPEVNYQTWRAFEKLYQDGKVKSIGVSNFLARHLKPLLERADIRPMVNQLEIHPKFQQRELAAFCQERSILVQAWSPFMRGEAGRIRLLNSLADSYQKSPCQICLRWCLQRGILPLPKSSSEARMRENLDVFDFSLSDADMERIAELDDPHGYTKFRDYELQQNY